MPIYVSGKGYKVDRYPATAAMGYSPLYLHAALVHYLARSLEGIFVNNNQDYWKANLRLLGLLLSIWFIVSFGFGILLVDQLNQIPLFGFKLGFWWAQQGAIYVFVILIFAYIHLMQRLDRKFGVSDEDDDPFDESARQAVHEEKV